MQIQGLQKLTLLDFPGRVACTIFLGGCDFRCPFCHNSELICAAQKAPAVMSEDEVLAFLETRRGLLDGVVISGGEPALHHSLPDFLKKIRALSSAPFLIKLDTNGNHPEMLQRLLDERLADYVAMDIKNSPARYGETIGIPDFDLSHINRSMKLLQNGTVDYEFRTTVVAEFHDDSSFLDIGPWIQGARRYFLQCFADRDTVLQEGLHAPSATDLQRYAELIKPYVPEVQIRGV